MLDNWDSFSSTLSDPFLDEASKFKDDFESTTTDFCDSLDSLSSEPLSSKSSVTSSERIYSYSLEDSESLDDRVASSSSNLNSIYNINPLDDDVFSQDLSLFDEASPSLNNFSPWSPKVLSINESVKLLELPSKQKPNFLVSPNSKTTDPNLIRLSESSQKQQPKTVFADSKILQMTVVSASTPVQEVIKAAGIYSTQFRTVKIMEPQSYQQIPTRIIVLNNNLPVTSATYVPIQGLYSSQRPYQKMNESEEDGESDMPPLLTREAPFQPEQLSPHTQALKATTSMYASTSTPYHIFECPKCHKRLPSRHSLAKHLHIHEPPRYKCRQCDKAFYERTKLRRHQVVHSSEKEYECEICDSKFSLEQNLRIHIRLHQSPFYCTECDHGFTQISQFKNHIHVNSRKPIKKPPNILKSH